MTHPSARGDSASPKPNRPSGWTERARRLTNLELLRLDDNEIVAIEKNTFNGLDSVTELGLDGNGESRV